MLHIHRAERADLLAEGVAAILADPPADPFTPELIAVPTRGMERWLTQRISARLGARMGCRDGICANVEFPFPGRLIGGAVATASGVDPGSDPWPPERSVWPLLSVVESCLDEPWLAQLAAHLGSQRRFGRLRAIADLFDQYGVRRPAMVQAWARGDDTDGSGGELSDGSVWQAELWRRLRAEIGVLSPAERLDAACALLRDQPSVVDLPLRLSLFGLTRLPASYVQALSALAVGRDVHLFVLHPSPALWEAVDGTQTIARAQDRTSELAANRLLRSWGVDSRELQLVLGGAGASVDHHYRLADAELDDTLLHRIQADVRGNRPPPGLPVPGGLDLRLPLAAGDRSITVHSCHGPARQVEVLREAIMHLLEEDDTLEPRDVIVMCPDIETFAPLIQATFGSASEDDVETRVDLRVRLADRSLRQTNPLLGVVAALIELAQSRVTASQMLDLADSDPVRRRFRFDDDDVARIQGWIVESGIRWGLDAAHRGDYRLEGLPTGTWRAGLQRLLLGVAMSESGRGLYEGVLPLDDVASGRIDLAGRFAEFVDRVGVWLDAARERLSVAAWTDAIAAAADALTATSERDAWQRYELRAMLADVVGEAGSRGTTTEIALSEIRALLGHRLEGRPTRANFRTGNLTVCTLVPMRSVPHRVVCLLGLDDGAFPRKAPRDGDDVLLEAPHVGDRNPRTEDRQMLLDALLAAQDQLIVLFSGNDERTNAVRPPAVPVGELLDAIDLTAHVQAGRARDQIIVRHPLQPFDRRNFIDGALVPDGPWGFDQTSLEGALALAGKRTHSSPLLSAPLPALTGLRLELEDLVQFVQRPVRAFLRQRLGIYSSDSDDEISDGLSLDLDGLERWAIGQRLLDGLLAGVAGNTCIKAEIARGALPPGALGKPVIDGLWPMVDRLATVAGAYATEEPRSVAIRVGLPGGRMLTGAVSGVRGDVLLSVSYSRLNPRHRLAAWVWLLALLAADPSRPYEAVTLGRARSDGGVAVSLLRADATGVREQLSALVDLRERGMRTVLPIAALTSAAYAEAVASGADPVAAATSKWTSAYKFEGEDVDVDHQRAFGGVIPFAELLGPDARFGGYAHELWDGLLEAETLSER